MLALPLAVARVRPRMDIMLPPTRPVKAVLLTQLLQQTTFNSNELGFARTFGPLRRLRSMNLLPGPEGAVSAAAHGPSKMISFPFLEARVAKVTCHFVLESPLCLLVKLL